jgi:hypothetical protein
MPAESGSLPQCAGRRYAYDEIADTAREIGLPNTRLKDARDQMEQYRVYEFVVPDPVTGWKVTEKAIRRFGRGATPKMAKKERISRRRNP